MHHEFWWSIPLYIQKCRDELGPILRPSLHGELLLLYSLLSNKLLYFKKNKAETLDSFIKLMPDCLWGCQESSRTFQVSFWLWCHQGQSQSSLSLNCSKMPPAFFQWSHRRGPLRRGGEIGGWCRMVDQTDFSPWSKRSVLRARDTTQDRGYHSYCFGTEAPRVTEARKELT